MSTYADRLAPYQNFKDKFELDEHVTLFKRAIGYKLNKTDKELLDYMRRYAVRYAGAFCQRVEVIAQNTGKSPATVKRYLKKITDLKIVKRIPTMRARGGKGATVFQFQQFKNEPSLLSHCENKNEPSKPCESKVQQNDVESKPYYSSNLSFKDTNITEQAHSDSNEVIKKTLKDALMDKVPAALKSVGLFFDDAKQLFDLNGVIFNAKSSVSKTVRIEDHEALFNKTIKSVYEYWKRQVREGKRDYNVFGLMRKAIVELTKKIVDGTAYPKPAVQKSAVSKELIPDWMIENEQDPVRKAELQAKRETAIVRMNNQNIFNYAADITPVEAGINFEEERTKLLARLQQ